MFVAASTCLAQLVPDPQSSKSLAKFLEYFDSRLQGRYIAAFADLNDDGIAEAIVHLYRSEWCGSGGCETLILVRNAQSWKVLTGISITRPPIRLLRRKSNGWRCIGVWVSGGGLQPGYEAELAFDGTTYPGNPSVPPARPVIGRPRGETLIANLPICDSSRCRGRFIRDSVGILALCIPPGTRMNVARGDHGDVHFSITKRVRGKNYELLVTSGPHFSGRLPAWARACATRLWVTPEGNGEDARCRKPGGARSRYITLNLPVGYAVYKDVPESAAAVFDRVLDSMCWNPDWRNPEN